MNYRGASFIVKKCAQGRLSASGETTPVARA